MMLCKPSGLIFLPMPEAKFEIMQRASYFYNCVGKTALMQNISWGAEAAMKALC
ncbi:hypothetical protein [Candidatus Electronema sp. JM]|uniref:hypothetical protein n=1 Tax=Candidatus Electronema sp. JM TaxID=3401571 RepID=UPI003AA7D9B6